MDPSLCTCTPAAAEDPVSAPYVRPEPDRANHRTHPSCAKQDQRGRGSSAVCPVQPCLTVRHCPGPVSSALSKHLKPDTAAPEEAVERIRAVQKLQAARHRAENGHGPVRSALNRRA